MIKSFHITSNNAHIQQDTFPAERYTFMCNVRHHIDVLTFAFKDKSGVWHDYELPCKANQWVDGASVDFTLTEEMTAFSLCAKDASPENPVFIQLPYLELANNKGAYGNNIQDYIESLEHGFREENINAELAKGKLIVSELSDDKGSVEFNVPLLNSAVKNRFDLSKNKSKPNYAPYGFWDAETEYFKSEFAIPFVKVPTDSNQMGYFVYALRAPSSQGVNPTTSFGADGDWRLIESVEFIFMQQAYIEHLQAELVTAERIEALDIVTSKLEVISGAKIGDYKIENGSLRSVFSKVIDVNSGVGPVNNQTVNGNITISASDVKVIHKWGDDDPGVNQEFENTLTYTADKISLKREVKNISPSISELIITANGIYKDGVKIL